MQPFTYSNTTTIHFGEGQITHIAKDSADAKVLFCYGGGSIKSNGVYDKVVAALADHQWGEFSGISQIHSTTPCARSRLVRDEGYTYILAVGGGSVVDGCKFIALAAPLRVADVLSEQAQGSEAVPLGCVLTLPATGSETNIGAVVSRGNSKLNFSPLVRPAFAFWIRRQPQLEHASGEQRCCGRVCAHHRAVPHLSGRC